jgi:hypothetical protein
MSRQLSSDDAVFFVLNSSLSIISSILVTLWLLMAAKSCLQNSCSSESCSICKTRYLTVVHILTHKNNVLISRRWSCPRSKLKPSWIQDFLMGCCYRAVLPMRSWPTTLWNSYSQEDVNGDHCGPKIGWKSTGSKIGDFYMFYDWIHVILNFFKYTKN